MRSVNQVAAVAKPRSCFLLAFFAVLAGVAAGCASPSSNENEFYAPTEKLTPAILDQSIARGRDYMIAVQRPAGNFIYEVNYRTGARSWDDNVVRQAGAMWALAALHRHAPSEQSRAAVERGLAFFEDHSRGRKDGRRLIQYSGDGLRSDSESPTGALALVALAHIEFIAAEPDHPQADRYRDLSNQYLAMLMSLRRRDGHFYPAYHARLGRPIRAAPSPFFDGEGLLALAKAVNVLDREDLRAAAVASATAMHRDNFEDVKSASKRLQYYQWGAMAYFEMDASGWPDRRENMQRSVDMASWTARHIRENPPSYNNAATYEGLIAAWAHAERYDDQTLAGPLRVQIEEAMVRLTALQVGGPIPHPFIQSNPPETDMTRGGVLTNTQTQRLRIDVTQHQMMAAMLARQYLFAD